MSCAGKMPEVFRPVRQACSAYKGWSLWTELAEAAWQGSEVRVHVAEMQTS